MVRPSRSPRFGKTSKNPVSFFMAAKVGRNPWQGMKQHVLTWIFLEFLRLVPIAVILANHLPKSWFLDIFNCGDTMAPQVSKNGSATFRHIASNCGDTNGLRIKRSKKVEPVFRPNVKISNTLNHHIYNITYILIYTLAPWTSRVFFGLGNSSLLPQLWRIGLMVKSGLTKQSLNLVLIPEHEKPWRSRNSWWLISW